MAKQDPFRTRDHVHDFDAYVEAYGRRSALTREWCRARMDIAYGPGEFEKLDLFFPEGEVRRAPIHLFIHGGYWRMFDKKDYGFVADTIVAAGGIAAVTNYDLMPSVRMETLVKQVRKAARWLVDNAISFGGNPENLTISGHSAGAHLCSFLLDVESPVQPKGAMMLSGIYDLAPLQESFLQSEINLTDEEIGRFSPLRLHYRAFGPVEVMAGENETAPFHEQARAMAEVLRRDGVMTTVHSISGANHMSIVLGLGDRRTSVGRALTDLLRQNSPE